MKLKRIADAPFWGKALLVSVAVLAIAGISLFANTSKIAGTTKPTNSTQNLKILKSEVTSKAKFYPYQAGNTYMEVIAVKARDGSIRTALNTCQVCYDSGRGYYLQSGNQLVCQNCGNRFAIEDVEVVRGGCNPVPIMKADKTEDGQYINISQEYLNKNKFFFARWKR